MGQHIHRTKIDNKTVTIRAGWDRPLQQFFMVIELDDEDGMLYSNLDDDAAQGCLDFKYFERTLTEFGLTLPREMAKGVRHDMIMNESVANDVIYP
jgi:hypothetical protein